MTTTIFKVHLARGPHGQLELKEGAAPAKPRPAAVPARIARRLALAHRLDALVRSGEAKDYATLAAVGQVTRARVSQILDLLLLAPDIQERLLDLVKPDIGRELVSEQDLRPVVAEPDWKKQRHLFDALVKQHQAPRNTPALA
jgi:hypothetical protein